MTIEAAKAAARAAFNAVNPHLDTPAQDFTVAAEVFDTIEAYISERQGIVSKWDDDPDDPREHMLWMGLRMYRGGHDAG